MIKFFERFQSKQRTSVPAVPANKLHVGRLCQVIQALPIGSNINFCVDFNNDVVLESLVLAYFVDGLFVYTNGDVICGLDDGQLVVRQDDTMLELGDIREFSLIVPTRLLGLERLSYDDLAWLGSENGLSLGSNVSVSMPAGGGRDFIVDAVVKCRMPLNYGHYAGHDVAMLDVGVDSFRVSDKRKHARLKTSLSVTVSWSSDAVVQAGEMIDYSERCARLRLASSERCPPQSSMRVVLAKDFGMSTVAFNAHSFRQQGDEIVVTFDEVEKGGGGFEPVEAMDLLQFKCALLQHPNTRTLS